MTDLRAYFAEHDEEDCYLAAREEALRRWCERERYCSACGESLPVISEKSAIAERKCQSCGTLHYPRIEPCIIVAIHRDNTILLAKHTQRNRDIYACIAGFVEAGEGLEHAVRREVREEVGIEITNIRYRGSQSWPFPDQLMLGFTADYLSGEIQVQQEELMEAKWFPTDALPPHPRPGSISYQLIHGLI